MSTLKKNYIIQKRNVLNELRANNMTLQELRFFSVYLSKIHKDKPEETRIVRFQINDFRAIMEIGRIDIDYIKNVTNSLLCKVVNIPDEHGGYSGFQLFKKCRISKDDNGEWYIEIDAHDDALPLMFAFKNNYFSYKLWNALRLRSANQLRMYEILKQYEMAGERILSIVELRALLGVGDTEYALYADFRKWVLVPCQKALEEHTDIKFTYEPIRGKGRGGKIQSLRFTIEKNENYVDQLTLDMYIEKNKLDVVADDEETAPEYSMNERYRERIEFFMEACNNEFSFEQVEELNNILKENSSVTFANLTNCYDYIHGRYTKMALQDKQARNINSQVKSRFGLLKYFIRNEIGL